MRRFLPPFPKPGCVGDGGQACQSDGRELGDLVVVWSVAGTCALMPGRLSFPSARSRSLAHLGARTSTWWRPVEWRWGWSGAFGRSRERDRGCPGPCECAWLRSPP